MMTVSMTDLSTALDNVAELRKVSKMITFTGVSTLLVNGETVTLSTWMINNVEVEVLHLDDGRTMFNATELYVGLCPQDKPKRDGYQGSWYTTLIEHCPDDVRTIMITRVGKNRAATNVFIDWLYLIEVVRTIDPRATVLWLGGKPFNYVDITKGFVYLVQSDKHKHVNSTVFKVGQTMNVDGRMGQYGAKRVELRVVPVKHRYQAEKRLKDVFNQRFDKHSAGNEFFECRSRELAIQAWDDVWCDGLVGDDEMFCGANEARDSNDLLPFPQLRDYAAAQARLDNERSSPSDELTE